MVKKRLSKTAIEQPCLAPDLGGYSKVKTRFSLYALRALAEFQQILLSDSSQKSQNQPINIPKTITAKIIKNVLTEVFLTQKILPK